MGRDLKTQPPQSGKSILIAILVFVVCAFGSAILVARHRDALNGAFAWIRTTFETPANPAPAPPIGKTPRPLERPLALTAALSQPTVTFPDADFSLANDFATTDFCSLLQQDFPNMQLGWQTNKLYRQISDCDAVLSPATGSDDTLHNSLFIQVRRSATGASTMVRLKLVYRPALDDQNYRPQFEKAAERILAHLLGGDAADLLDKIRDLKAVSVERRGITIKFFEEQLLPGAYDLMVSGRCLKYECSSTDPFYSLSLSAAEKVQPEAFFGQAPDRQETQQE